jgi:hypothetical protein
LFALVQGKNGKPGGEKEFCGLRREKLFVHGIFGFGPFGKRVSSLFSFSFFGP